MSLPYRWDPIGCERFRRGMPEVGDLIAHDHAVWRVTRAGTSEPMGEKGLTQHVRVVPVDYVPTGDPVADRNAERPFAGTERTRWDVYPDEHYPMCASCREPMPCRERMAAKVSAAAADRLERYTVAGVCPACREPVTTRQESVTWEDNVVVPGGPPVTFHLRSKCYREAVEHEKRWAAAEPGRRTRFTCGDYTIVNHGDGTYTCSSPEGWCPGPNTAHTVMTHCDCPDHWVGAPYRHCHVPTDAMRVP